jgi:class I fructose-bisphosphate aldolase
MSRLHFVLKPEDAAFMKITPRVKKILAAYESDNPGTKSNLARILMNGRLGGTGKLVILPVDQGFEHGPARSFAPNPPGYEPHYHWQLAVDAGLSAFAAPLGMIEDGADTFAGAVPTILKVNSANSLNGEKDGPVQAITAGVQDALRLGCSAIGYTMYPGSERAYDMMNDLRELTAEAKDAGLAVVVWSYPRGKYVTKDGETGFDVIAYAAHMAALMGAHIIKVKLPTDHLDLGEAKKVYEAQNIPRGTLAQRVNHIVQSCFGGRRIVVFSGGAKKGEDSIYEEAKAIRDGGGNGSIIGRNAFQRPLSEANTLLGKLIDIYKGKDE